MFPSTYSFPHRYQTAGNYQSYGRASSRKPGNPNGPNKARQLGRTPHEIVTIASLIETESASKQNARLSRRSFIIALPKSIPLGIDQTAVYVAKMQNRWDGTIHKSDLEVDSPYNTRRFGGIPPGPISSVSESALKAAFNPAQTDYIFYVLNVSEERRLASIFYSSAAGI